MTIDITLDTPAVNLNGGSPASLISAYLDAANALREAQRKLEDAMPNGRDFQTLPDGAERCRIARARQMARIKALIFIQDEMDALAIAVDEQASKGRRS